MQKFFRQKFQRRRGQSVAECVNVFEKAVLDTKTDCVDNELMTMGWHPFEKGNWTLERQECLLEAAEGEYDFAVIQSALIKVLSQSRSSPKRSDLFSKVAPCRGQEIDSQNLGTGGKNVTRLMRRTLVRRMKNRTPRRKTRALDSQT